MNIPSTLSRRAAFPCSQATQPNRPAQKRHTETTHGPVPRRRQWTDWSLVAGSGEDALAQQLSLCDAVPVVASNQQQRPSSLLIFALHRPSSLQTYSIDSRRLIYTQPRKIVQPDNAARAMYSPFS
jgi:hypothetical protein